MTNGCKFIYRWVGASVVSFLAGVLLSNAGWWFVEKQVGHPYSYLTNYYNYYNHTPNNAGEGAIDEDIVIIDAHDESLGSRSGMAEVIKKLSGLNPKVVGMDIIYSSTHETTRAEDDMLRDAIVNYPGRLVLACRHHGPDSLEHSFFTGLSGKEYGTVNSQSFFGFVPRDSVAGGWVDKMVYVMAGAESPETPVINYENVSFREINRIEDITSRVIDGKYVLIGDCTDSKDEYDLPFKIEGKTSLPGVRINAYQLSTLIHPRKQLVPLSSGWSNCICFLLLFLFYGWAACWWSAKENSIFDKAASVSCGRAWGNSVLFIVKPIVVILLEIMALLLLILVIHKFHRILNVVPFMAALLFFGTADKVISMWVKRIG